MHGRISRDDSIRLRSSRSSHAQHHRLRTCATACVWAMAIAHWGAAGSLLMFLPSDGGATAYRAIGLVVLAGLGTGFAVVAYRRATAHAATEHALPVRRRTYWQSCGAVLAACYALGLFVGDHPSAPYLFLTSLALGHAAVWLSLSGAPNEPTRVVRMLQRPPLRAAGWTISVLLIAPLAGELGLRLYALAADDLLMPRYIAGVLKLSPGGERLGQTVNSHGYWDDEFPVERLGSGLRIAALGDEIILCGDAESNFLTQVERLMPGTEILNFGVPQTSPREYAAQLETTVAACRPDVVLICISVATDITEAPPLPGSFDWRSLHLVQRSLALSGRDAQWGDRARECTTASTDPASLKCLDDAARQLEVCRVPVQDHLQTRWREVFAHLDGLVQRCRDDAITPILVGMPCEFQIDERLRETLCRRAGYREDQIDVDLPQRRLAAYATDRGIQMVDLMPHLRASRAPSYRCDADQFNKHGNSLAAIVLCDWLESQYGSTLLASGS